MSLKARFCRPAVFPQNGDAVLTQFIRFGVVRAPVLPNFQAFSRLGSDFSQGG
jgi:hypothetical protein